MKIKKIAENVSNALEQSITTLSTLEKQHFKEKIKQISSKYNSLINIKKTKSSIQEIDPMLFCFEDLPPTGKEYWFMKFSSTKPADKRQLLVMFGNNSGNIKINQKKVKCKKDEGIKTGYMTAWSYDNTKDLIFDTKCSISVNSRELVAYDKQNKISYEGNFPNYALKVSKKNKEVINIKITKSDSNSKSFEFSNYFKSLAGYALINLYFDFTGTLNGEEFTGKCYVQKVVVIGPFVPWYWGRIVFSNGSVLTYHEPRIQISKFKYKLLSTLEFYDNTKDKNYIFENLNIKRFGKKNPRWVITADNEKVFISLKSYSSHKFTFEKIGFFTYHEYLCEVTDISFEDHDIDTSKLVSGFGLVEDARGYIL
jgi:hypothetical protein